jgi:hypothetical protein
MTLEEGYLRKERERASEKLKKIHTECPEFLSFEEVSTALQTAKSRVRRMENLANDLAKNSVNELTVKFIENEMKILEWRIGKLELRKSDLLSEKREERKQINFFQ